ncbi:MAG: hypothetical protein JWM81_814 [Candidatus Saccharibacteria bacterium]|nr:hypothetical protein [Candidatus Saccharibacteria bacterium]
MQVNKKHLTSPSVITLLGSKRFFWGIMVLMVVQAVWIALTARYPMAFDEDFHLGIIRLYAHHISPFWANHPSGADAFGAVARDPSYLFHYLMSFPYRLIAACTDNQTVQVLFLRAINIGLLTASLPLYRKLLLKTGASRAMVQTCLLLFVLVPIVPMLAAQINYDNLLLPLTALFLLCALKVRQALQANVVSLTSLLQCLSLGMFAGLVKYAFLPIFVAVVIYLAVSLLRTFGFKASIVRLRDDFLKARASKRLWLLLAGFLVLLLLSFERYGVNIIRYHTPVPDCGQVLTVQQCSAYGPWIRDYNLAAQNTASPNPANYLKEWLYGMWFRSFFAVDGPSTQFQTRGPLFVPAVSAIIFVLIAAVAAVRARRWLWQESGPAVRLFVLVTACYIGVLFLQQYKLYSDTGQPVAINGRYLLPLLPLVVLVCALAVQQAVSSRRLKVGLAIATIACFAYGGGALTYILRSNDTWYWDNGAVRTANHAVQRVIGPVVPGNYTPTAFLR